jgi:hypothetical protein
MSRRKIFEGVRRRTVGRHHFPLVAEALEERTLLSTLIASLPSSVMPNGSDPVGVTTDSAGDVYFSYHEGTGSSGPIEAVADYTPNGQGGYGFKANVMAWTGPNAVPGPLVTLQLWDALPNLQSEDILELQPDGELFAYRPSTLASWEYGDFGGNAFNTSVDSVYDIQTKAPVNLNGTISLTAARFGDFGGSGSNLVVSAQSNGWDFVMQTTFTALGYSPWTVEVAAPTSDGSTVPKGLTVNYLGTALTTLPDAAGSDVPVTYYENGPPAATVAIANFGLPVTPTINAGGITVDSSGNFVVATGATSLLTN